MTEPTFIIPGASRGGTTSLHYYLQNHPDIFMSEPKELRFFDRNENYTRGLDYYEEFFREGEDAHARGESSPPYWNHGITFNSDGNYRWNPTDDVPHRVYESYPDIKLIFTLRNPVTRSYSQYWKNVRQGREHSPTFKDAIQRELNGDRDKTSSECCWVYKNDYATHLEQWLDLFDRDQILFLVFEEWIERPERALNHIAEFLGVRQLDEWSRTDEVKNQSRVPRSRWLNRLVKNYLNYPGFNQINDILNIKNGYPNMDADTEDFAFDVFEPIITDTEVVIDRELDVWRQ